MCENHGVVGGGEEADLFAGTVIAEARQKPRVGGYLKWEKRREEIEEKKRKRALKRYDPTINRRVDAGVADHAEQVMERRKDVIAEKVFALMEEVCSEESSWPKSRNSSKTHERGVLTARALRKVADSLGMGDAVPDEQSLIERIPGRVYERVRARLIEVAGPEIEGQFPEFLRPLQRKF